MLRLDDIILQTDTQTILNVLKSELAIRGIDRFHIFRPNGSNIQTNCPFHKQGQERKPSFGISGEKDKCHCFACGWSGSIEEMVSELFGYNDAGKFGKNWLVKRFNSVEIETRPNILEGINVKRSIFGFRTTGIYADGSGSIHDSSNSFNVPYSSRTTSSYLDFGKDSPYISEEELDKYRYIHPYMYERGLTDEIIERFDIGYDRERKEITFPVRDIGGRCVFVAGRSVKSKFFRLPKEKDKPVYQGYRFMSGDYKEAYITESFLNCLTCWKYGKPAMALIGTGNEKQYKILEKLPVRTYILALDPDEAGRKGTERFRKNVHGKIIKELVYTDERDINDLQEEFLNCKIIF